MKFLQPGVNTIRSVVAAFSLILLVLLAVSALSFFGARKVEENYQTVVTDAMLKLELVNKLHQNEDAIYSNVLGHLSTASLKIKSHYEERIHATNQDNALVLRDLRKLLQNDGLILILNEFENEREEYVKFVRYHLEQSSARTQTKAELISSYTLAHVTSGHQRLLIQLNDSIRKDARMRGDTVIEALQRTITDFNLLLLLGLLLAIASGTLVLGIVNQLKKDNLWLNAEIEDRQQLEVALNESQRQYKNLFNYNPVPLWVYNLQDLGFIEVNEAAMEEYGYTREEFLTLKLNEIIATDELEKFRSSLTENLGGTLLHNNWRHRRKDGSVFSVETIAHTLPPSPELQAGLVVAINVDERQRALSQLEHNEKQLREISSSIPGAVFQFKLGRNQKLTFTFISEGFKSLYQASPEELYADATVVYKLIQPDDLARLTKAVLSSYKNLTPLEEEYRLWLPEQSAWKWIRVHGLPTYKENSVTWNGTFIDITKQKEAQQQLISSEANLRAIINSAPEAIYLLDKEMHVLLFNQVAEQEVATYLFKTLTIGQSILHFIDEPLMEVMIANHACALKGDTVIYETGRGNFWLEVAFRPILGPDNQVLAVAFSTLDISEQKLTLETIKRSERQLARAQQLAHLGNWEYDLLREQMTWSEGVYDIHNLDRASFKPSFYLKYAFIHSDERERVRHKLDQALEQRRLFTDEYRILLLDGTERIVYEIVEADYNEAGMPVKMSGALQDITERKAVEREVTEAKNLLQSTLENIPEVIFSTDKNFHISYISAQSEELTGYAEDAFYEDPELWLKLIKHNDRKLLTQHIIPDLVAGKRQQCEVRLFNKDHKRRWILLRLSPLLDSQGNVIRIDGAASDMTLYKQAEKKRTQLTEDLLRQNQNLQQFAYIVSHNLRAPIANILGLTSIYEPSPEGGEKNSRIIDNLRKSAKLLDSTILDLNEILTIRSEISSLKEEVSFELLLQQIEESLAEDLNQAGAQVHYDFSEAPNVVTIKSYLHSIMMNLITNAVKYKSPDRNLELQLRTFRLPNYICLSVADNGIGIDLERYKDKIFGLYRRFHSGYDGKGLGLHLVKTQSELLGGRVEVESQVNKGTTFMVYFKS